ncbi:MAG: mercury methylation corrinoid protein HgcA [Bacillota bacterium]|nr:mercury methylation corrinoid protein HgcA [Bacillota bacterium]
MNDKKFNLPMVDDKQDSSCCVTKDSPTVNYGTAAEAGWVVGHTDTPAGPVYRISTSLDHKDLFDTVRARLGIGRMRLTVPPGLYAVGSPGHSSPVLVSANYKLSFDALRRELTDLNLWILVLDTKGINVWCAAGKNTFGTDEVIRMIRVVQLEKVVTHRNLILPQLAAPGVSAHKVRRQCSFRVIFGPVRASDVPAFIKAGNKADPAMRRVSFGLRERLVLAPVELTALIKPLAGSILLLLLLNIIAMQVKNSPAEPVSLISRTFYDLLPFLIAALAGVFLVPVLLPYIPGRSLAWKGFVLGLVWAFLYRHFAGLQSDWLITSAHFLIIPAITAFLGMNFTGSTTYTSLSGVVKEMKIALPMIIASSSLGIITLITTYFI